MIMMMTTFIMMMIKILNSYNYVIKMLLASDKRISEFLSKLNDPDQLFLLPHTTTGTQVKFQVESGLVGSGLVGSGLMGGKRFNCQNFLFC